MAKKIVKKADETLTLLKIMTALELIQYGKSQEDVRKLLHVDANWLSKLLKKSKPSRKR